MAAGTSVKLERISYQYADGAVAAYDFHPRLTIIDVHPKHRRALLDHLVSALSTDAPGVHVEATFEHGPSGSPNSVVAFRPYGAQHRVIDVESGADVTSEFLVDAGHIDLLRPVGLDPSGAAALLVGSVADLTSSDPTDRWTARLLGGDIETTLTAAARAVTAERELREATTSARATPQFAAAVETAHESRNTATALETRHNRIRIATLVVGSALPLGAVVSASTIGNGPALAMLGGAVAIAFGCLRYERRLARAVDTEFRALADAGADSYLALDRLTADAGVDDAAVRARLLRAAEDYRTTSGAWQQIAEDIPAPWVVAQAERLRSSAALRAEVRPVPTASEPGGSASSAALLDGLTRRASAIGDIAEGRESLPLFLDDPLDELGWKDKVPVLEVIGRLSERQQLVLATDDPEVLAWAQVEAMAGTVTVVDVNPGRSELAGDRATAS